MNEIPADRNRQTRAAALVAAFRHMARRARKQGQKSANRRENSDSWRGRQ
ncbi:MAG TPA: hypothetical protein VIZ86_00220 [Pseudomonas sp.]